jgi:hypothetical protein
MKMTSLSGSGIQKGNLKYTYNIIPMKPIPVSAVVDWLSILCRKNKIGVIVVSALEEIFPVRIYAMGTSSPTPFLPGDIELNFLHLNWRM